MTPASNSQLDEPAGKRHAGGRPRRGEARAKQVRMLEVAQRHFLTLGYAESSLDAIAHEAGVAKKTLYEHFGDKAGLFAAAVQRLRDDWESGLRKVVLDSPDPEQALRRAAIHLLDVGTRAEMLELHRLLLLEARRFPDLIRSRYGERGAPVGMAPLTDYLRLAAQRGVLQVPDADLATEQFVQLVLGGLRTRMLRGVSERPAASARAAIARQAVHVFLHGMQPPRTALSREPT